MTTATKTPVDSIRIPDEFVAICDGWYDGMGDMVYAVSSTGNLTTGTIRPAGCDSDEQWYLNLWCDLSADLCNAVRAAKKGYNGQSDKDDYPVLVRFEDYVDSIIERLEREYGLEDWSARDG